MTTLDPIASGCKSAVEHRYRHGRASRRHEARFLAFAMLISLSSGAIPQNTLDLDEADTRNRVYDLLSRVEDQFDCDFAEESLKRLGDERYLVRVSAAGEDCDTAMTYLVSLAERDDELVFRRAVGPDEEPVEMPAFIPDNALIHEINPDVGEEAEVEDDDRPEKPHTG